MHFPSPDFSSKIKTHPLGHSFHLLQTISCSPPKRYCCHAFIKSQIGSLKTGFVESQASTEVKTENIHKFVSEIPEGTSSTEVKTENIHKFVSEIPEGTGNVWYNVNFLEEPNYIGGLKFHRIVLVNPSPLNLCPVKLAISLTKLRLTLPRMILQVSFICFLKKNSPILKWDLERLATNHGLVCDADFRIPWGGWKGKNPYFIITFQCKKTPEQELLEEDEKKKEEVEELFQREYKELEDARLEKLKAEEDALFQRQYKELEEEETRLEKMKAEKDAKKKD